MLQLNSKHPWNKLNIMYFLVKNKLIDFLKITSIQNQFENILPESSLL